MPFFVVSSFIFIKEVASIIIQCLYNCYYSGVESMYIYLDLRSMILARIPFPTLSFHFTSHQSTVKLLNMPFVYFFLIGNREREVN